MILTDDEKNILCDMHLKDPWALVEAAQAAVIRKLAAGVSVEPAYKAKPYSNLPTVVVSAQVDYYSRDQLNTAIAAARVAAIEECAKVCDVTPRQPFRPSIEAAWAIRALLGKEAT